MLQIQQEGRTLLTPQATSLLDLPHVSYRESSAYDGRLPRVPGTGGGVELVLSRCQFMLKFLFGLPALLFHLCF